METVRRWVFPIIWMLICGVLAASLAKMAFFSGEGGDGDDGEPTAAVDQFATVEVSRGDVAASLELSGTVTPDPGKPLTARTAGEINKIWVSDGQKVSRGDRILQVKVPQETDPAPVAAPPVASPAPSGAPVPAPAPPAPAPQAPAPRFTYHTLHATGPGTIRGLSVSEGQVLEVGATVATLSPDTYAVVADLTPEQQLRLLDQKITAKADLPTSDAPLTCDSPKVEEDAPAKEDEQNNAAPQIDPMTGMPAEGSSSVARLRCPIPRGTKIVPGLPVTVDIGLGTSKNVLTVPITAVEGSLKKGAVFLLDEVGGEPARHEVTLGRRSGEVVEVVSGLKEGQQVLQFAPGEENPEDTGGMPGGMGW